MSVTALSPVVPQRLGNAALESVTGSGRTRHYLMGPAVGLAVGCASFGPYLTFRFLNGFKTNLVRGEVFSLSSTLESIHVLDHVSDH